MKYRLLGKSGLRVSEAALGTMTFGDEWGWGSPKDEAQTIYETYREAGGNFIDTANFYTSGTSEKFLGEFIKGHSRECRSSDEILQCRARQRSQCGGESPQEYDAGAGSQSETIADRLHRPVLGAHLGWNYTSGRSHARPGLYRSPRQGSLRRHLGRSRLVGRPGKYS